MTVVEFGEPIYAGDEKGKLMLREIMVTGRRMRGDR